MIVDTDILSMFAKVKEIDLLVGFLGQDNTAMTPAIHTEISIPLQYGYSFPNEFLSRIPVVPLTERVWRMYERLQTSCPSLGRGELEAIAFCKVERALFATNDSAARTFARQQGVQVISLQAILKGFWRSGLLSREEVRQLLERIKTADNLEVPSEVKAEIFGVDNTNRIE